MAMKLNLTQTANAIATIGHLNTVILRGEPGVGKSDVLKQLAKKFPDYHVGYIDCANLDLGDIAMPIVDKVKMVTNYAPNARFGITADSDRPVIVMLDELGKATKSVLNMLLPLILEGRLGDIYGPKGSIVFATTNLDTDGVGDNIPAHAYNRMTEIIVPKPTDKEWLRWAADNDIDPVLMAAAKQYPEFFESYADLKLDHKNPYIFDPRIGNVRNYVSPRSLAKASNIVKARDTLGDSTLALLAGTIGEPAARMLEALTNLADQIPDYDLIVKKPEDAKVPDSVGALFLLAFMMAGRLAKEDVAAVCKYAQRMEKESFEAATLFVSSVAANNNKIGFAAGNREFSTLMAKYGTYF